MILVFRLVLRFINESSLVYRLFNHTKEAVITGLIISGMTSFLLPMPDVLSNLNFIDLNDKINLSCNIIIFGMILAFPALYLACMMISNAVIAKSYK